MGDVGADYGLGWIMADNPPNLPSDILLLLLPSPSPSSTPTSAMKRRTGSPAPLSSRYASAAVTTPLALLTRSALAEKGSAPHCAPLPMDSRCASEASKASRMKALSADPSQVSRMWKRDEAIWGGVLWPRLLDLYFGLNNGTGRNQAENGQEVVVVICILSNVALVLV